MTTKKEENPLKKVCIICAKGSIEDVYATLVMANGAVMEGIEAKVFFTFFGLDAITKKQMNRLKTATVGNPAMRMPGGLPFPTLLGALPFVEAGVSWMMKKEMDKLDIPPIGEFVEMVHDAGAKLYACKATVEMFHLTMDDFCEQTEAIINVGKFYEVSAGGQIIFT